MAQSDVQVDIFRADLIDKQLGGNKLFKLWGHLHRYYRDFGHDSPLASFGGAYSNHLYALAALGQRLGLNTIGFVRGQAPRTPSPTLKDLKAMGMSLRFLDRQKYREKSDPGFLDVLVKQHKISGPVMWIPEGGGGTEGLLGMKVLGECLSQLEYNYIVHACGTGTSLAGLIEGLRLGQKLKKGHLATSTKVFGVSALRSHDSTIRQISGLIREQSDRANVSWALSNQYHHGGFAKISAELQSFIANFTEQTAIPLDRVYTGKVLFAVSDMLKNGIFEQGTRVLVIHSGGLQGNRSI